MYSCFKCSNTYSEFDKLKAHLKNNHENQEWPWICGFCDLVLYYDLEFEVHIKQHTEKPPFACPLCSRLFSDNTRLREHLARQHLPSEDSNSTGEENFVDGGQNNSDLENTSSQIDSTTTNQVKSKQQAQWQAQQIEALERFSTSKKKNKNMSSSVVDHHKRQHSSSSLTSATSSASAMASTPKDEAAVSRELAALLLNLHDSNGGIARSSHASSTISNITTTNKSNVASTTASDFNKAEDLSLKSVAETAIDLTKAKPEITLTPTMPASITKLVKGTAVSNNGLSNSGVTVTKTSVKAPNYPSASSNGIMPATSTASSNNGYSSAAAAASYPFYPSLASMASLSPTLAMNSNYLLQNLLLGKFQQIANSSSNSSSSNNTQSSSSASTANNGASTSVSSNMALPTHPLPAQTLSLPASKPPASVLKTAASSTPGSGNSTSSAMSNGHDRAAGSYNLQLMADTASGSNGGGTSSSTSSMPASSSSAANNAGGGPTSQIDIPYMCRQIVTLLNGLLFHQHNLNNPNVELNVHTQLGAIYARLQEVVVMVEQAKKQQEATTSMLKGSSSSNTSSSGSNNKKESVGGGSVVDSKTEEKIAKHIHEYQRALLKQHEDKEAANSVDYLKKQALPSSVNGGMGT